MTLYQLLLNLRKKLIIARQQRNLVTLEELSTTFTVLEEAIGSESQALCVIVSDMGFAARDSLMKTDWKSSIPTTKEIQEAIST